jgi:hypothetical protein
MKMLGLVVLAACGSAPVPPAPRSPAPQISQPLPPMVKLPERLASAPRPALDVPNLEPDLTDEPRWPLSVAAHPAFEPRFDIAGALAQRGVGWLDLCRMGAQRRTLSSHRELERYLRAWCMAGDGHPGDAIDQLAVMGSPTVAGMGQAIREDIANLLAQNGGADAAEKLLATAKIEDVEIFDLLAATYFELGKPADAYEINERAIDRQRASADAAKCHRFARRVLLTSPGSQSRFLAELDQLGAWDPGSARQLTTDPVCDALDAKLHCSIWPRTECGAYLYTLGINTYPYRQLLKTYFAWPDDPVSDKRWTEIALAAASAEPAPRWDHFQIAALLAGYAADRCLDPALVGEIHHQALGLHLNDDRDRTLDPIIDAVLAATDGIDDDSLPGAKQRELARSAQPWQLCQPLALQVP